MKRILVAATSLVAVIVAAACSTAVVRESPPSGLALTSPGRADNEMLTRPYAGKNPANANCVGENLSPALAWTRAPAATKSLAIVMDDQAGRNGLGVNHWVAYGIAPPISSLVEGEATSQTARFVSGKNTLGMPYLGPCPPRGNAPQHYVFTLIATSLEPSALPAGLTKSQLLESLNGRALGAASLVVRFSH